LFILFRFESRCSAFHFESVFFYYLPQQWEPKHRLLVYQIAPEFVITERDRTIKSFAASLLFLPQTSLLLCFNLILTSSQQQKFVRYQSRRLEAGEKCKKCAHLRLQHENSFELLKIATLCLYLGTGGLGRQTSGESEKFSVSLLGCGALLAFVLLFFCTSFALHHHFCDVFSFLHGMAKGSGSEKSNSRLCSSPPLHLADGSGSGFSLMLQSRLHFKYS
jgi:hypothetical protein